MNATATVLCPIDFSDAGRGALRYARAIVEHFGGRLIILTVEDPLLTEAIDLGTGIVWDPEVTRKELADFSATVFGDGLPIGADIALEVAVGKPAEEILRTARKERCDLIVMSTHGLTGARKFFFGSTTERVLRETTVPVLATPATDAGPDDLEQARRIVGHILVPVDLTTASSRQVLIAGGLARALDVPLILTHVIEPVRSPLAVKLHLHSIEVERRARAEDVLRELIATVPAQIDPEALVVYGDPAEEITKVAGDRHAGLILVGLHGSPMLGPRMGSVTYRVLCLTPGLVLAVPPAPVSTEIRWRSASATPLAFRKKGSASPAVSGGRLTSGMSLVIRGRPITVHALDSVRDPVEDHIRSRVVQDEVTAKEAVLDPVGKAR